MAVYSKAICAASINSQSCAMTAVLSLLENLADETQSDEPFPLIGRFNGTGTRISIQMNVYGLFYIHLWMNCGNVNKAQAHVPGHNG